MSKMVRRALGKDQASCAAAVDAAIDRKMKSVISRGSEVETEFRNIRGTSLKGRVSIRCTTFATKVTEPIRQYCLSSQQGTE
jgi:hypothetical protein